MQLAQPNATGRRSAPAERPRAYTIEAYCRAYGIGRTTTYSLIKEGKLRSVIVGGRRLITADSAEALLNEGRLNNGAPQSEGAGHRFGAPTPLDG